MSKKLTTEEFIRRAKEVHGDKYDYSKVEYVNNTTKIEVICSKHGSFFTQPSSILNGHGCPSCSVRKKLTKNEFIERAKKVHNGKYDYSKVEYVNVFTDVLIICPIHGNFYQKPHGHLLGCGCKKCGYESNKKLIYGIGINDVGYCRRQTFYEIWNAMLQRCYCANKLKKQPSYIGCSVDVRWRRLSVFKEWFDEHYIEGFHLDKDILIKGNKVYSPENCCFVPQEINNLFVKCQKIRGKYPIGVKYRNKKYYSQLSCGDKKLNLGIFDTVEDAFNSYKKAKESWIKEIANKWKDKIEPRVYEALYNYKVEITD